MNSNRLLRTTLGREIPFDPLLEIVVPVDDRKGGAAAFAQEVFNLTECEHEEKPLDGFAVKGDGSGGELVLDLPLLLVGGELSVFCGQFSFALKEPLFDGVGTFTGAPVMERDFNQSAGEEMAFERPRFGRGESSLAGADSENPQLGLISSHGDSDVEPMLVGPIEEWVGGVAPLEAKRGREDGLAAEVSCDKKAEERNKLGHAWSMGRRRCRNKRRHQRGALLVEATYALTFLTGLSLVLLKLAINVTAPRQWTLQQTVTDAYLTYEKAYAQRLPFADLVGGASPWPAYPSKDEQTVELGKLPGGKAISAKVIRTRLADSNNLPVDGGSGTEASNPAGMKVWRFQSLLVYELGGREYVKSRTIIRSQ